jgi:hypothetical protein
MPQIGFKCKKGDILFEDCLKEGYCEDRCLSRASLTMLSKQRPWKGVPSTTQLIKGTMEAYLQITTPYYWPPGKAVFALQGTKSHSELMGIDDDYSILEEFLDGEITSKPDILEAENSTTTLIDKKLSGSYKVAMALGIYSVDIPTGQFYKNGKEKTKKAFRQSDDKIDMEDWILQLNHYRLAFNKRGFHINKMKIEAIVRDGGTYMATGRGITENHYMIDVPIWPDQKIIRYFDVKRTCLETALANKKWTDICSEKERWNNNKCKNFCAVAFACPHGERYT